MAAGLADAYQENVNALRESFETIRDTVAAGWIGAALAAIWGIIKTIIKLFEMLMQLLSAVVEAINAILDDPIGFLMNLIDGIKLGLDNFVANIKTHLITGLIEWLTGSLGGVGITIPENLFSLKGIFNLAFQIMGLSWDYFRAKAVKKLGEPVVQGIELAVDIFQIVKKDGADGLWEFIKEKFQDLQATVMDAIRDMIIQKVVEAGIKWIIGLMNPASAFVKAVMMIIDIAKFFIERAADIIELVMAFIDGIRALAAGNIQGVAKMIEKALAKAIPILLGFLASLLGITGLTGKVTKIIKKIKGKVDKAINKIIAKAFKMFKKKGGKGKDGKKPEEEVKGLTPADHKKHKKYVQEIETQLKKPPKKKPATFEEFYASKKKEMEGLEKKYNGKLTKKVNGKPLKTTITMGALAAEKKDEDLDIKIKIAPNDSEGTVTATMDGEIPVTSTSFTANGDGSPTLVKGTPISKEGTGGSHKTGGLNINGWEYVEKLPNFKSNWVRFHVLNALLHGPAHQKNLIPTPKAANNTYKTDLENPMKEYADAGGVFNFEAKVKYYKPGSNQVNNYHDKNVFRFFPSEVNVKIKTLNTMPGHDKVPKKYDLPIDPPTNLDELPLYLYDLSAKEMNNQLNMAMDFAKVLEAIFKIGTKPRTKGALQALIQAELPDLDFADSIKAKVSNWTAKSLLPLIDGDNGQVVLTKPSPNS